MTSRIPAATLIAAVIFAALSGSAAAASRATHLVQLRDGVSLAEGRAMVREARGEVTGSLPIIHGLAVHLTPRARARLGHDPRIAAVTVNAPIRSQNEPIDTPPTTDASTGSSAETTATSATTDASTGSVAQSSQASVTVEASIASGEAIDASRLETAYPHSVFAPSSWSIATGKGVGVAVIDTGVDGGLPDFADADGKSRVVASVVTNPAAATANDTYGHGTHVAGIIAGDGTRRGGDDPVFGKYIGIAPRADLIAIKASDDDGRGTILDAIYGLQFAVDHKNDYNIRVVNLSLSSTAAESYRTDPLDAAVESAHFHGILVVAAAGNRGGASDATWYAPGNDPFALSVGAIDDQGTVGRDDDVPAEWSSVGVTQDHFTKPDLAAPGAHIVSTLARGSAFASMCSTCVVDGDYIRIGGTSMAAPVASGVAALLFEKHPDWTPDQVKSTLIKTARGVRGDVDELNAAAALATTSPKFGAQNFVPNALVDAATGEIDYVRSSWGRSSWGAAPESLVAGWARSSWGCACSQMDSGDANSTRSSWGSVAWLARWTY